MTATEWLINQIHKKQYGDYPELSFNEICEQAIEMEKQQIINAANLAVNEWFDIINYNSLGEQYYNETFKK